MYMYYKNDAGKIDFRFGGDYPVRITDIDGLYPLERTFNTVKYADIDGEDTISSSVSGRNVTVGGDIKISNKQFLRDMLKVLDKPGELYMDFGEKKRKLVCRSSHFTPGERNSKYMRFVIVFSSDMPYFYGFDEEREYIRKREDVVSKSFVLPQGKTKNDFYPVFYDFNILENGDFEEYTVGTDLKGKWHSTNSSDTFIVCENIAKSGENSLAMVLNNSTAYSVLSGLEEKTQYTLSFYYKGESSLNTVMVIPDGDEVKSGENL